MLPWVRGRVDTAVWNLGLPLAIASGCTRIYGISPGDDGTGTGSSGGTLDTTVATATMTVDPSLTEPTTIEPTTVEPTDSADTIVMCETYAGCPGMGECCVEGSCVYMGCPEDCPPEQCCYGMCGNYGCYGDDECGPGAVCNGSECEGIELELDCMLQLQLEFQIPIEMVGGDVRTLAFIDADGDSQRDVVIGEGTGVELLRAVDQSVVPLDPGIEAVSLAVGDLDGDMDEDVLVADRTGGTLRMLLHDPMMTFVPVALTDVPGISAVALVDSDGDGVIDLLTVDDNQGLQWLRGLGGAVFDAPVPMFAGPTAIAVGSIDGDTLQDTVVHQGFELAFTQGSMFLATQLNEQGLGSPTRALAVGNFDGAPPDDVVALHTSAGTTVITSWQSDVLIFLGHKSWFFGATTVATNADLDDDGYDDVIAAGGENQFVVLHGAPGMGNSDVIDCVLAIPTMETVSHLAVGDFTGDGELDVVTSDGMQLGVYVQTG
jgi:hypothetical protein